MIKLSIRLRNLREDHNLTQEKLAKEAGVSYETYRKYEMNSIKPKSENLERLAKFYNMTIDELLGIGTELTFQYDREDLSTLREVMDSTMPNYLKIDALGRILDRLNNQWKEALLTIPPMSEFEITQYSGRDIRRVSYNVEEDKLIHRAAALHIQLMQEEHDRVCSL